MSIFANRKSKPKASFLSHTKNISQRGTLFWIHANFHEFFDQLKQVLQCIFVCYWNIKDLDYKRGMIIFQDVIHIISNCEKICRKAKQNETSSILICTSCYMRQCRRNLVFRRSSPPPFLISGQEYRLKFLLQKATNCYTWTPRFQDLPTALNCCARLLFQIFCGNPLF